MTQVTPNQPMPTTLRAKGRPNIYTALLVVASLALLAGCVFIAWQSKQLFGTFMPELPKSTAGWFVGF